MQSNAKSRNQLSARSNSYEYGAIGKSENSGSRRTGSSDQRMNIVKQRIINARDYDENNEDNYKFGSSDSLNITLRGQTSKIVLAGIMLPEDMRISKLLRRLSAENNATNAIDLCDKLKLVLGDPANHAYVRKSFDILADSIMSILKSGGQEWLCHVAEVFGKMGYVIRNDFAVYRGWILRSFKGLIFLFNLDCVTYIKIIFLPFYIGAKVPPVYLMKALYETFRLDEENGYSMFQQSEKLMEKLKELLENCVQSDLYLEIIKVIEIVCRSYPDSIEPYFSDLVDIVVGWHLEMEQSTVVKYYSSRLLQEFKSFWEKDIKFTLNLLGQFLEDIQGCGDDYEETLDDQEKCFGSFVGTFNTVLKCIYSSPEYLTCIVGPRILMDSFENISTVAKIALIKSVDEEMIINLNEYLAIIIDCYSTDINISSEVVAEIFKLQINRLQEYNDEQVVSLLFAILKYFITMKNDIPFQSIAYIMSPDSKLMNLRFSKDNKIQNCLIRINQEILNLKNIELLQEAYKHILCDIGGALQSLPDMENEMKWKLNYEKIINYSKTEAEFVINFHLSSLANLATSNSSILAVWALQPTILDLFANWMNPTNYKIW